ncbi:hypothetical protein AB870_16145 [Pandoraea faecigallinarum]|uniref:Autotransporter domain-containing protein n=1 Tax=Pandoraea faecigallinarum TaxID=656179 RepID=A0A0H3WUA3_9BURK|nr:autotransporter outer membrane beta-barrel domain-containing protein [Pandoraea faecigallinarum]AKM31327.1 hypothetical protein AB870_16145 [Pandoraea faecigallinarum]
MWRFGLTGSAGWLHVEPEAIDGYRATAGNTYRVSGYATYQSTAGWYADNVLPFGNQVLGRLGVRLVRPFDIANGRVTPYAAIDYLHAFSDGTNVNVGGIAFTSGKLGDAIRLSLGANATMTARMSLYGRVSWSHDRGNAGMRGWLFNAGARYVF